MRIKLLLSAFCAALLAVIICTSVFALGAIPSVVQYQYDSASGEKPFTVSEVLRIDERINEIYVGISTLSFCADAGGEVVRGNELSLDLVNETFLKNYKIDCPDFGGDTAVISRGLALKLFYTEKAQGQPIQIGGKTYKVGAVYDSYCDDGRERVYLSYEGFDKGSQLSVTELQAKSGSVSAVGLEQMKMKSYYRLNLSEKRKVLRDFLEIVKLLGFVFLCLAVMSVRKPLLRRQKERITQALDGDYALKSLRKRPLPYLLYGALLVLVPAALVGVFFLMRFGLYIIPEYIPLDNIFDLPYYLEQMKKAGEELNRTALMGNGSFIRLYHNVFISLSIECAALAAAATATYISWKTKTQKKTKDDSV